MKHGKQLGRNKVLDGTILNNEQKDAAREHEKLHELGEKFTADKDKLEDAKERVKASKISDSEKQNMLAELDAAIERAKEEYDEQVAELEQEQQREMQEGIDAMQEAADEAAQQADSLRNITMDAASVDASAAADAAEEKQREFEQMRDRAVEELNLKIEQANIQRRNMRASRLGGR